MELNHSADALNADYQLAMDSLLAALPNYPPEVEQKLDFLIDEIAWSKARATDALEIRDHATFRKEEEAAAQLQALYDFEVKRYHRHERIRKVAKSITGWLK